MNAINSRHQGRVNKAIKFLIRYNALNERRNVADGNDDKAYRKLDKQCELVFDKYQDVISELPKREVEQIEKSDLY